MAAAKITLVLCFGLCFLVMTQGCKSGAGFTRQRQRRQIPLRVGEERGRCEIQSLRPEEPSHRVQHEAGVTEMWEQNSDQMQCANVAATRHVIEPNGLLLPNYNNAPMLFYVVQGKGILGAMIPGCPETYESFQGRFGRRMGRIRASRRGEAPGEIVDDQHQKLHFFSRGDLLALPAGVSHWCYNDGDTPLLLIAVHDMASLGNQLDQQLRRFYLAGNPGSQEQQRMTLGRQRMLRATIGNNIFRGFNPELLAEAFGVSHDVARQLQCENDPRGAIVHVEEGLRLVRPPATLRGRWRANNSTEEEVVEAVEEEVVDEEEMMVEEEKKNGLEETFCSMRLRENIEDPERADVYTVRGGRVRTVTSSDLPILRFVQLSAKRGYLYRNAIMSPQWNMNAHEIIYCIRGRARVQVVGSNNNNNLPVFDGELREGQLLVIPQNFASLALAGEEGFEWITFMTSDNAMSSPLAGRVSVIRGLPDEVLMNMFIFSREDARRLKYNRPEMQILSPRSTIRGIRASA